MDDYNFWQDLFDTYQSLPDWLKFAWLVVPPAFLLAIFAMIMHYRLASKHVGKSGDGELVYSVRAGADNELYIYRHDDEKMSEIQLLPINDLKVLDKAK